MGGYVCSMSLCPVPGSLVLSILSLHKPCRCSHPVPNISCFRNEILSDQKGLESYSYSVAQSENTEPPQAI